jgi:hypothetical protein
MRPRLPAFGRRLRDAIEVGYMPWKGGGCIVVTTEWDYARGFDPGRVVCPSGEPVDAYDFTFLHGCDVIVLVPEADEIQGEALTAAIRSVGASLVVLSIDRGAQ